LTTENWKTEAEKLADSGMSWRRIAKLVGKGKSTVSDYLRKVKSKSTYKPRILLIDIETAPLAGAMWQLFNNNTSLNQIERDWYILSWAAKWHGDSEIFYSSKKDSWHTEDDTELLAEIWLLLDQADIVIGQNLDKFDIRKLNARFIINGFPPPSSYRTIDTVKIARKYFGFTSNKLEYLTQKLCKKYKKIDHREFPGYELWKACISGNARAWEVMQEYNCYDILSLEELYDILRPWHKGHPNMGVYREGASVCSCGKDEFNHTGYHYTNVAKYDRFRCGNCGAEMRGTVNLIPKELRKDMLRNLK
jgi:hypothetical protein